jgi:ParB-like chromosome segregation protein Spo0J
VQQPPHLQHPVANVQWVPLEKVQPNEYNPNHVAPAELELLYRSIREDGYTQPVVTYYDADRDRYIIIDGYHRYLTMKNHPDIRESTGGLLPVVVVAKDEAGRMASTVRHNRARGTHEVTSMANIVMNMLEAGMSDAEVCRALGMEPDELVRLKHLTGFAKLFAEREYSREWVTRRMVRLRREYDDTVQLRGD